MKEHFKIVTTEMLRDSRMERRIIEYNRQRHAIFMILAGAIITFVAIMW